MRKFATHIGIYMLPETDNPRYTDGLHIVPRSTLARFRRMIGWGRFARSKSRVSYIIDPLYHYLHRLVATSAELRVVQSGGSILYVFTYMARAVRPHSLPRRVVCGGVSQAGAGLLYRGEGAYIMQIAVSQGLVSSEDPLVMEGCVVEPSRLTRQTLISMHVTHDYGVGISLRFRNRGATFLSLPPCPLSYQRILRRQPVMVVLMVMVMVRMAVTPRSTESLVRRHRHSSRIGASVPPTRLV
ncbi:hypothetical protein Hanom_Chr02g00165711 [Helianthus anomalus]